MLETITEAVIFQLFIVPDVIIAVLPRKSLAFSRFLVGRSCSHLIEELK